MTSSPLKECRKMFAKKSWTPESNSCVLKYPLRGLFPATTFFSSFSSEKDLVEDFSFFWTGIEKPLLI